MRTRLLAVIVGASALGLVGCGGGGATTSTAPPGALNQADLAKLQTCLAQHGVKAPNGGGPPAGGPPAGQPPSGGGAPRGFGGPPSKKMQRAFEACRQYAPGPPGGFAAAPPGGVTPSG